jgi:hypothetical protein
MGFGLLVGGDDQSVVSGPADQAFVVGPTQWVTIIDLPPYQSALPNFGKVKGHVDAAAVHDSGLLHGRPCVGISNLSSRSRGHLFDFRRKPFDTVRRGKRVVVAGSVGASHTLNYTLHPQLFETFVRISESMTSVAYSFRGPWRKYRKEYFTAHELKQDRRPLLKYGDDDEKDGLAIYRQTPPGGPRWMPRPYVGVSSEAFSRLADMCCKSSMIGPSEGLRNEFLRDLSKGLPIEATVGGSLGSSRTPRRDFALSQWGMELPREAKIVIEKGQEVVAGTSLGMAMPSAKLRKGDRTRYRWETVKRMPFGGNDAAFRSQLRHWFFRQAVKLDPLLDECGDTVFVPADLLDPVPAEALSSCGVCQLIWRVDQCFQYYNSVADAFVFPPLRMPKNDKFRHELPWGVYLNATPWIE